MAAEGWLEFLLLVFSLGDLVHPCDTQELRCQCIRLSSDFISPKFIKAILVIPENIYCSRKEVIALLENGKLICLNPEAEWVRVLIRKTTLSPNKGQNQKRYILYNEDQKSLHHLDFKHPLDLS